MNRYHIGLRTIKTGLAVAFALLLAGLRGSPAPIFAAIGSIVAMSRTWHDAVRACLTQLAGITCGVLIGWSFQYLTPGYAAWKVGVGIVLVILACNVLRLRFAVPLSCIVFVSVCLLDPSQNFVLYGINRLLDTSIGLVTALAVNLTVKPYNNRAQIADMIERTRRRFPAYLEERVLKRRYPDLTELHETIRTLDAELAIFTQQPVLGPHRRAARRAAQAREAAYLMGCAQLLTKMTEELTSLCTMDTCPAPSPEMAARLAALGLDVPETAAPDGSTQEDRIVQTYHLNNLLQANDFLTQLSKLR